MVRSSANQKTFLLSKKLSFLSWCILIPAVVIHINEICTLSISYFYQIKFYNFRIPMGLELFLHGICKARTCCQTPLNSFYTVLTKGIQERINLTRVFIKRERVNKNAEAYEECFRQLLIKGKVGKSTKQTGRAYLTVPVLLTKNLFDSTPAGFCNC